ncbi:MAG: rod shape-determining protein MreC, partial [Acidimicrobiales bacterium]
ITLITIDARTGFLGGVRGVAHEVSTPVSNAFHDVLNPVGNFLSGAVHYGSLRAENQRLRREVSTLENKAQQNAANAARADQVLAQQHLAFVGAIPAVTADVVERGASNFDTSVTLGKGSSSGLAVGQPVVAAAGLVGTVTQVTSGSATVTLLTDPTFVVGVTLDASNTGSAQGYGLASPLRVTVLTTNQTPPQLSVGKVLDTSGLQMEKFPPGIPVGAVSSFSRPPAALEPNITIKPVVKLAQLTVVTVLLWSPQ